MGHKPNQPAGSVEILIDDNYKSVFESFTDAVIIWNENGRILDANPAACVFFSSHYEDLRCTLISKLESHEKTDHIPERIRLLLEQGHTKYVICLKDDNGTPAQVEVSAARIVWSRKTAFCSIYRRIHQRKIDSFLLNSNVRLQAITDSVKDAILMMDGKGRLSFWNPAAEQIFGYSASEVIGKNLHNLLAPSRYHQAHKEAFNKFQQTGKGNAIGRTLELEACHKDGHEISIELSLSQLHTHGELHSIGIIRDITDRKKAEIKLKESEERFRILHNASFGGIVIHDKGLILDCNQGLSEITGYMLDELIGMKTLQLIAPHWESVVLGKIQSGYKETYEVEGLRKDGSIYPLSIRCSNIPYKGNEVRVTEFRDITDQKQAEKQRSQLEIQLIQAQKMETIGTLAGGIAHDFNNILSAIIGYIELSRNVTPTTSPAAQFLDKALQGAQRASSLAGQILAFSRKEDTQLTPLHITPIIKEVVKLLRPLLPSTIKIVQHIQGDSRAILADQTQIHQIIMNLCTNAFHAMEQTGGTLTIELKSTELQTKEVQQYSGIAPGHFIIMTIGDTGPGIQPEMLDRIFDPYFTTKSVGKGSGMGLSIVHSIVKNYGGFIKVDSTEGNGAWFHVYLPTLEQVATKEEKDEQPPRGGCERILLVDDEELVTDIGRSMLEHLGYHVTVFNNSMEALSLFKDNPSLFDMVITDQTMPFMTGVDITQQMLKIRPDIPIIICTGYSSTITKEKVLEMGARGFMMKPIALKDLSVLARKVLDGEH